METGRIELAIGPMFSGKSEWLIEKLRKHEGKDAILAIRYKGDDRYSTTSIFSHNGDTFAAKSANHLTNIIIHLKTNDFTILGIDEIQFYEPELKEVLFDLRKKGKTIYTAGLDVDYLLEPWETTEEVAAIADSIEKLLAQCVDCGKPASKTQRLIDGKPAPKDSPRILIGARELYIPRCEDHFILVS